MRTLVRSAAFGMMLSGCAASSSGTETPAVIVSPDSESRHALQQAVNSLLGRSVMLANDALTRESSLVIERTPARDPSGRKIEVRDDVKPEIFRLVSRDGQCVLIRESTREQVTLERVRCAAAK